MKQALTGAHVFDGETLREGLAVIVEDDRITAIEPTQGLGNTLPVIELGGGILAPGFIDLQVNGGGGVLFNNDTSLGAITTMLAGHRSRGTTSMLPTLISDTAERQRAGVEAIAAAVDAGIPGVLGVHIEGPFFNLAKRGAHQAAYIRAMDEPDIDWLTSLSGFKVMLTLAPECAQPGQIQRLADAGITVCAGHTNATYEEVMGAIEEGLKGFTHLYNAMRPLLSREPGVVGAALADPDTWCGIIVDGHHAHPAAVRAAYGAKPQGKLFLVTDAMATVGAAEKSFEIYGETIHEDNGRLINADGLLAGSAIGMIDAVRINTALVGIPLEESLRMASLYPAQFMQLDHQLGRINTGHRADLVHFDNDFIVRNTWVAGEHQSH